MAGSLAGWLASWLASWLVGWQAAAVSERNRRCVLTRRCERAAGSADLGGVSAPSSNYIIGVEFVVAKQQDLFL